MQTAVCLLPVVPVRKEPSHRSEMVSQLLFGEYVKTGEEKDDFVFVECVYDGYEGWVQAKQVTAIDAREIRRPDAYTANFATPVTLNDRLFYVPYASPVYGQNDFAFSIAGASFTYLMQPQQTWTAVPLQFSAAALEAAYQPYLRAPYLWGGKSVWGTDCSGFVQQVFKLFGIRLLRDAYLQADQGVAVSGTESRPGDLAFFQNAEGRVTHVGIALNEGKIIHASGEVRIDDLEEGGIVQTGTGKLTHEIHSTRRLIF